MTQRPFLKFYARDWRSNVKLRSASLAARGLWIDLMTLMHEAEPYGYLVIAGDRLGVGDAAVIAQHIGSSVINVRRALDELVSREICALDDDGTIYSSRMLRDEQRRLQASEFGQRGGGSPLLKPINPTSKGRSKLHARERDRDPDARDQSTATPSGARTRETRPLNEPFGLADWIWGMAFERGLIGPHRRDDRDADVRRDLPAARRLLGSYPVAEIQTRTHRFLAALHSGEIKKATPTASSLARVWDFACVAPPRETVPANGAAKPKYLDVEALD